MCCRSTHWLACGTLNSTLCHCLTQVPPPPKMPVLQSPVIITASTATPVTPFSHIPETLSGLLVLLPPPQGYSGPRVDVDQVVYMLLSARLPPLPSSSASAATTATSGSSSSSTSGSSNSSNSNNNSSSSSSTSTSSSSSSNTSNKSKKRQHPDEEDDDERMFGDTYRGAFDASSYSLTNQCHCFACDCMCTDQSKKAKAPTNDIYRSRQAKKLPKHLL
jgi:hypothetical protein